MKLQAEDLFDSLEEENEEEVREIEVETNATIDQLLKGFETLYYTKYEHVKPRTPELFKKMEELSVKCYSSIEYTAKDIEQFTIAAIKFENDKHKHKATSDVGYKLGLYISSLINTCKDTIFHLHIEHYKEIIFLGKDNSKEIHIYGDEAHSVGEFMKAGKIHMHGNVHRIGGELSGGEIIVDGNVGMHVGTDMTGGKITVYGNTSQFVGDGMKGGELIIHGIAGEQLGFAMEGGFIHVKGDCRESVADYLSGGTIQIDGQAIKRYSRYAFLEPMEINGGNVIYQGKHLIKNGGKTWWFTLHRLKHMIKGEY